MKIKQPITPPTAQSAQVQGPQIQAPQVQSPAAQHGGLVVDGGPLVPNAQRPQEPITHTLTMEELQKVGTFAAGVGLKGHGVVSGIVDVEKRHVVNFGIATQQDVPVLVMNKGSRSQMSFELDLPLAVAKAHRGQEVSVSGLIEKTTAGSGRITGVQLGQVAGFPFGTWMAFSGQVENRNIMGIGGEAPPSGSWLKLDQPITVGGQQVSELYLEYRELADGARLDLTGRLDARTWGGVERPATAYVALTGVTDQTAGEPAFDGRTFRDDAGKELEVFSWVNPQIADVPSTLFVLDQGHDKVWIGASGGHIRPETNPFHGFSSSAAIEEPNAKDRAKIGRDAQGKPTWGNQKLDLMSETGQGPGVADGMTTQWYRNAENGDLLRFQNGGFAGFNNYLDQIVRNADR
jgi:hypothetical protein